MNDKIQNVDDDQSRGSLDFFMETYFLLKFGTFSTVYHAYICYEIMLGNVEEDKAKIFKF
ncbi:MAG: hypothetical protein HWN81_18180 [Candidatus Lokiarchaeota archaeon]|nr:hypothetical protein [Candidatus Lokiarchaeota archaeon]